jgi:hypothetical protein
MLFEVGLDVAELGGDLSEGEVELHRTNLTINGVCFLAECSDPLMGRTPSLGLERDRKMEAGREEHPARFHFSGTACKK